MKKALLVIDIQNDYFPGGNFPLWNTEKTLENIVKAIGKAKKEGIPVIHVQHIGDPNGPFFVEGTEGFSIHPEILKADPNGKVVSKKHADSFYQTELEEVLSEIGVEELLICGMMTHNCVNHTAISRSADKYKVKILPNCCTTVSEPIHMIALDAVSTLVEFGNF